jgi:hypothetical protein
MASYSNQAPASTFGYEGLATTNYGTNAQLSLGQTSSVQKRTSWVRFSSVTFPHPPIASVSNVVLTLYSAAEGLSANRTVYVYLNLRDWVEGQATWNIFKTSNNWGTAGARNSTTDYNSSLLGSATVSGTIAANAAVAITLDNTLFLEYINNQATYPGGFEILLTETGSDYWNPHSNDAATSTYRPKLTFDYTTFDDLVSKDIATTPTVTKPVIGQKHVLVDKDIATTPTLTKPTCAEVGGGVDDLVSKNIATTPTVTKPVIGQKHVLTDKDIATTPTLSKPTMGAISNLVSKNIATTATVTKPVIAQIHALVSKDFSTQIALTKSTLVVSYNLSGKDISVLPTVTKPVIGQKHALSAFDIVSRLTMSKPTVNASLITARFKMIADKANHLLIADSFSTDPILTTNTIAFTLCDQNGIDIVDQNGVVIGGNTLFQAHNIKMTAKNIDYNLTAEEIWERQMIAEKLNYTLIADSFSVDPVLVTNTIAFTLCDQNGVDIVDQNGVVIGGNTLFEAHNIKLSAKRLDYQLVAEEDLWENA